MSSDQTLDWPRYDVRDDEGREIASDEIPKQLKNAVAEYAHRQLTVQDGLQPDEPDTGAVKKQRDKVDVVETEDWGVGGLPVHEYRRLTAQ